jgi:hypothetical protein
MNPLNTNSSRKEELKYLNIYVENILYLIEEKSKLKKSLNPPEKIII